MTVIHGDCLEVMAGLPDNSVDAIVTDPPYGLGFMGKTWDDLPPGLPWAVECLRVLKPGGHLLAFGGTRTWHRLAVSVEDAGFEIRDSIAWLYGSGFPKSLDISKAIDKAAHARPLWDAIRGHLRVWRDQAGMTNADLNAALGLAVNGSGMARHWTSETGGQHAIPSKMMWLQLKEVLGWPDCDLDAVYAAVKDGEERPVVGMRTARGEDGTVIGLGHSGQVRSNEAITEAARQWDGWGTALKPAFEPVVVARKPLTGTVAANVTEWGTGGLNIDACRVGSTRQGRWPANVALDDTQATALDQQTGQLTSGRMAAGTARATRQGDALGNMPAVTAHDTIGDTGGASRFFPTFQYQAKAPTRERPKVDGVAHPTVKPVELMRWLVRLVTPPGGTVLDPFAGSGTTLEAARLERFDFIGIEREADYLPLIQARLDRSAV